MSKSERHAIIKGENVVNVIMLQEGVDYETPEGERIKPAPEQVAMGWKFREDAWIEPVVVDEPNPEPEPISPEELSAKQVAVNELVKVGISQASARLILGLD